MTAQQLFRLAGAAAIAGGALRILVAFPLIGDEITLQWLYTAIDVLLLFGLIGIYLIRASILGFLGLAGFVIAVAALSFIGGPDADPFGFSTYEQGAITLVIALIGLSIAWVRANERPLAPPILWFASALAGSAPLQELAFMLAGVLFGAAFVLAGWDLILRTNAQPNSSPISIP